MTYQQLRNYHVCQICGRYTFPDATEGWLVSPLRADPTFTVVRCPKHISEWSLRRSRAGRTKKMRAMMEAGKQSSDPIIPPHVVPFPMSDNMNP